MSSIFIRIFIVVLFSTIFGFILFKFVSVKKLVPKQELATGPDGAKLLKKYENKELDDAQFLKLFSKVKIYYSTPLGDTKDGGSKLFLIQSIDKPEQLYHPVFISIESATEFFEKAGRATYMLLEDNFLSFLKFATETYKNAPSKVGVTIEPFGFDLDADQLDNIIKMIES